MKTDGILWVDDEIDLLRPYVIYLEEKGYNVQTANNGRDAIELYKQHVYDIVFLDENMPGLTGLETLALLKEINDTTPVVMITKSEEENIMDQAIGSKIADYLIKPVNPTQILLTLKKHIHKKDILNSHTTSTYRSEFMQISDMIACADSFDEWVELYRKLVYWELELQTADAPMQEMLKTQMQEANAAFGKFIKRNYEQWFAAPEQRPVMSTDLFKTYLFPRINNGEKCFFVLIDNFRYDQWKTIQPLLSNFFNVEEEHLYSSILPTATQYARNAIFSGLMPLQIQQMFPDLWVNEDEDEGKNLQESNLIKSQLDRYRKKYTFSYHKINESNFCEKVIAKIPSLMKNDFNVIVINFIDMLSHSRTESKMMKELANNEAAYRSLTLSWFRHSPVYELFSAIAKTGAKLVITTDHGTVNVNRTVKVVGDKNTNVNLRYKVGKSLAYNKKEVMEILQPKAVGLPLLNLSSAYIFALGNDFFAYPNNYNHYVSYYQDTFQHGGVSMEEMLVPCVTLSPK